MGSVASHYLDVVKHEAFADCGFAVTRFWILLQQALKDFSVDALKGQATTERNCE